MSAEERLVDLAVAIADGSPIDWRTVESSGAAQSDPLTVEHLRVISEIVSLHRKLASSPAVHTSIADQLREHEPQPPDAREALPSWGPLRLIEMLGQGSFGEVYRAWDPHLDREVALKLLRRGMSGRASGSSFVEEGRLLAKVRHPNVITVFGADRIGDHAGIWMELVDGGTLEQQLRADGPFPAGLVAKIGRDLARALGAVHRAGLLHRDIKAQNVMRDRDGRIVLMDFGAGREEQAATASRELAGTPLYLAPEMFEGAGASVRSDVYSLGVLLYHLATGSYPVEGATVAEIRDRHGKGSRTALASRRRDLPSPLVRAIDRALAPDPAMRYENADEMSLAFESLASPRARRRTIVVMVAALVLAGIPALWLARNRVLPAIAPAERAPVARLFANLTREGARPVRISLKRDPCGTALTPDGRRLYVSDYSGDALVVIDTERHAVTRTIPLPGHPCALAMSPDGRNLFVGRWDGRATILRTSDQSMRDIDVQSRVSDLLATPDGRLVYIATPYAGLWRLDTASDRLERIPAVGCPMYLASDGVSRLYVSFQCEGPGGRPGHDAVGVFDLASGRPIGHAQGPPRVGGPVAASPDATFLWASGGVICGSQYDWTPCPPGSLEQTAVNVFQASDSSLVRTLPVEGGAVPAFLPGGARVFVGAGRHSSVFDARSFAVAEAIDTTVIGPPRFTTDGTSAWVFLNGAAVAIAPLPADCELPTSGLSGLWTGDGSADDLASSVRGQLHPGTTFAPGMVGQAFAFDGLNGQVTLGQLRNDSWGARDATLLAWVKFLSVDGTMSLADQTNEKAPESGNWRLQKTAENHLAFCIGYVVGPEGCGAARVPEKASGTGARPTDWYYTADERAFSVVSTTVVRPNVWYHVAVTKRAGVMSLYVNGRREATISVPLRFGREGAARLGADESGHHLHGLLDEVARYARALEPAEIARIYRNATAPACTGGAAK